MNKLAQVSVCGLDSSSFKELTSILFQVYTAQKGEVFLSSKCFILPMPSPRVTTFQRVVLLAKGLIAWCSARILRLESEFIYWAEMDAYALWLAYSQRFMLDVQARSSASLRFQDETYPDWIKVNDKQYSRGAQIEHLSNGLPKLDEYSSDTVFLHDYAYHQD